MQSNTVIIILLGLLVIVMILQTVILMDIAVDLSRIHVDLINLYDKPS
jgi:hypothetical protein